MTNGLLPQTYLLGLIGLLAIVAVVAGRQLLRVRKDELNLETPHQPGTFDDAVDTK